MHGEVEHLQRLVEDLRVLSLADAGELSLARRPVDPAALLERTALAYIVDAERHGVALCVEAPADLPSIMVDTDRMTQVLNNLVSNALRYTPADGTITLRAERMKDEGRRMNSNGESFILHPSSFILLEVSDTGSGIAPEDLPFVFDRFYRADKARQRNDSAASGLGLAITKAIVEAHGGTIAVESRPGAGTTFTLSLPLAPQEPRGGHTSSADTHPAAATSLKS